VKLSSRTRLLLAAGGVAVAAASVALVVADGGGRELPPVNRAVSSTPYSENSIWRTPIPPDPQLDPQNSERLAYWLEHNLKNPNMPLRGFGVAVVVARPGDPKYDVKVTRYQGTLGSFGPVPIPDGTRPPPSSDGHLAVYDPIRRIEWNMWQARCCWEASAGQAQSTASGDGIAPAGTAGANAANFPFLGGLVLADELRRGRIDHALHFSMPDVRDGYVCPATHDDGDEEDPLTLQEGTQMQLDPSLNVDALDLPKWQKTIARALQRYGMYLRDGGGTLAIAAENTVNRDPDPWTRLFGKKKEVAQFSDSFPWHRMRILEPRC
jgi:hypothetical protein